MTVEINLVFHNQGLRSYIEVDLCANCPRQDDKGCCGFYSPVFYLCDLAYLLKNKPELIDYLFSLPNLTILDASVTVNSAKDGTSYRCQFHTREKGCLLPQQLRESICRHFVCPGIGWEREESLKAWRVFFEQVNDYEIALNHKLADRFSSLGLSLRSVEQRDEILARLPEAFEHLISSPPDFFSELPALSEAVIYRELSFGVDWKL